jgi:endonuclease I
MEAYGESKIVEWNREHIWSKSRGDFSDDDMTAHNDAHHLVAAERVMNSTKNNRFFEDCHDGDDDNIEDRLYGNFTCNIWEFEPRDDVKGDVARMIFYMAVRYEDVSLDLEVVDDPTEDKDLKLPVYGDLDDLIRWHLEDPVSEAEARRNDIIYAYQGNRNPFIDNPEFVEMIWQLIITTED